MEAPPKGMTSKDFAAFVYTHVAANYEAKGDAYVCKKDGAVILQTSGVASIHSTEFGNLCAGGGSVKRFPLPYCPTCEGTPKNASTCVHIPMCDEKLALAELLS